MGPYASVRLRIGRYCILSDCCYRVFVGLQTAAPCAVGSFVGTYRVFGHTIVICMASAIQHWLIYNDTKKLRTSFTCPTYCIVEKISRMKTTTVPPLPAPEKLRTEHPYCNW
eukprot:2359330-Rhodomonas_salina.1